MLAIPADAPHPVEAHAFIDFLLRPAIMAGITNQVRYPNAVPASAAGIRPEVAADPAINPPADVRARFFTIKAVPQDAARARARMWARFKSGR
jgi:putrescine transport system substrate-binding protein